VLIDEAFAPRSETKSSDCIGRLQVQYSFTGLQTKIQNFGGGGWCSGVEPEVGYYLIYNLAHFLVQTLHQLTQHALLNIPHQISGNAFVLALLRR
jgi:hypothetical protein